MTERQLAEECFKRDSCPGIDCPCINSCTAYVISFSKTRQQYFAPDNLCDNNGIYKGNNPEREW